MKQHNYRVDIYKFIMTILCALMHFEAWFFKADRKVFEGGYLAVDFFFVLDGFLLYQSYRSKQYVNAVDFTWKRFKRFFPYATSIVFGFVVIQFFYNINTGGGLETEGTLTGIANRGMDLIGELIFLQVFISSKFVNFVTWYISVLLVMGFVLYEYLEYSRKKCPAILFLIFLSILHYIITNYGNLDTHTDMTIFGSRNSGVLRGTAEMCVGIAGAQIIEDIKTAVQRINFWITIEIVLFIFILADLFVFPHTQYDDVFVVGCAILIPLSFYNGSSETYSKFFKVINKITFTMFFSQNLVRQIWFYLSVKYNDITRYGFVITLLLFFVSLIVFSILFNKVIEVEKFIMKRVSKK